MKRIMWSLLLIALLLSGCQRNSDPDFVWGGDMVHINIILEEGGFLRFTVPFLYQDSDENPEVMSVSGKGVEDLKITVYSEDYVVPDFIPEIKENGYYYGLLAFAIDPLVLGELQIDSIQIRIAGQEETVDFPEPITVDVVPSGSLSENQPLFGVVISSYCFDSVEKELPYQFKCVEEKELTGVALKDYYETSIVNFQVNGKEISVNEEMHISLREGDVIDFFLKAVLPENISCDLFMTNLVMTFSDGTEFLQSLVQQANGDENAVRVEFEKLLEKVQ